MSETNRVVIIGAGGHGREILDVLEACIAAGQELHFAGFLDDGPVDVKVLERRGALHLGGTELIEQLDATFLIGIGSPVARRKFDEQIRTHGKSLRSVAHPAASLGSDNRIGPGAVMWAGARMTTNISVGRQFHLASNAAVGHDCVIGDYVTILPGATVSGNVQLGDAVTIGTGANLIQGISVGAGTTVGAGAVVIRDLPANVTAVGAPARALDR